MTAEDSQAILDAYNTGHDPDGDDGVQVRLVPVAEIEANGWDLNIGRYLKAVSGDEIDLDAALKAYREAREARIVSDKARFERLAAAGVANLGGGDE